MNLPLIPLLAAGCVAAAACGAAQRQIPAPEPSPHRLWPSTPPPHCPFPPSETLAGVAFTGRHAEYTGADTWYPSWASDGNLYSPWTDGTVNGLGSTSGGENAATGHATILGEDPLHLVVTNQGVFKSSPRPYEGRYPCGSLVHDGVWYYGTYCLHPSGGVRRDDGILYNWPWLGPFVGFRWSTDLGNTWTQTPCTPEKPLFSEHALKGEPVTIGAPHFVDFGRNLEHSPDGKAYLVAQGARDGTNRRFAYNSWITADHAALIRVQPGIKTMNDAAAYEFFAGHDQAGTPLWTRDLAQLKPVAEWRDHMGCVTMTYVPPLRKFLLCVTDGGNTVSRYSTYLLEADRVTGPWKLVTFMKDFGEQAYFVNLPSKFISSDGRSLWLCYAANFSSGWGGTTFRSRPPGSRYAMCLQEIRLLTPSEVRKAAIQPNNIARDALVTVSSTHPDYSPAGATDGVVGGYPGQIRQEWASHAEQETALLRLTWNVPQTIDRVWLFDRPNTLDQITSGMLVFGDGSTLATGPLPDDARQGLEVAFPPKTVAWLMLVVTGVKPGSPNIGLSEIQVFAAP
ncbi:MAG TPA: hypothetical protein PKM73_15570 [Verrucomicrobiota bacterium]|nr:hypothetical protein [Verrucomicrobiota bacterium]HNU50853.1 hypothetical protein [Verrucomicrobiota bacterium]